MASARQLLFDKVTDILAEIRKANGYQTQPLVCANHNEALQATEHAALWVTIGVETFDEQAIAGRHQGTVALAVNGIVRQVGRALTSDLEALLQDVRNAVQAYSTTESTGYSATTGAAFMGFGECETDEGLLAEKGEAFFRQTLTFAYNAGPTW